MMRLKAASKKPLWTVLVAVGSAGWLGGCEEVKDCLDEKFACQEVGVAGGNAKVTGNADIDGFFEAVVNYKTSANTVVAGIDAELAGIRADFGLAADANVATELQAKLDATLTSGIQVRVEPPRCEVNARAAIEASVECQKRGGCEVDVDPGEASFECSGRCEMEVSGPEVEIECGAEATLECEVTAPEFACTGRCEGTCTVEASAGVECHGSCDGACDGMCEGSSEGGACNGTCHGSCDGSCVMEADVAVDCQGTCDGKCTYEPGSATCEAGAKAYCDADVKDPEAKVECSGQCDGSFTPPSVSAECDVEVSCNAQAKADAELNVECSPASVEVFYEFKADVSGEDRAQMKFAIGNLRARLGNLAAATKKSGIVVEAGVDIAASAVNAFDGVVEAAAEGDLSSSEAYRIATCLPKEAKAVGPLIDESTDALNAKTKEAVDVQGVVGM